MDRKGLLNQIWTKYLTEYVKFSADFIQHLSGPFKSKQPARTQERLEMAPYTPLGKVTRIKPRPDAKQSAVLVLLYPKEGETHFVLIERNTYEGVHSGQIGLPGGRVEPGDGSFEATALRETQEELGVNPKAVTMVRALSDVYIPPSNFLVYPFVGYMDTTPVFNPDSREVYEVVEVPKPVLTNMFIFCIDLNIV